ncbi:hypothetical protein DM860_003358 [Cuscuta australis]|uniref:Rho-GAP domain-containing protein n=1 Tax=Cuscuta australis TaxID=267555 RepID=A0A328DJV5_9ASTE|nr:hypothetical protein DM860_003358 [Cuscuta australis]
MVSSSSRLRELRADRDNDGFHQEDTHQGSSPIEVYTRNKSSNAEIIEVEGEEEEEEERNQKNRKEREEGSDQQQLGSIMAVLVTVFRKSLVSCSSSIDQQLSSSPLRGIEISWPSNVRHVSHVTFDRFNGFLGLPVEFEPDVPRKPPSASARVFGVSTECMQLSFDSRGNCVPTILLMMQGRLYAQGGLQAWFRELPRGVLDSLSPEEVMSSQSEEECVRLMRLLPPTEASLLDWAINLMADVAESKEHNKMNARNVALVFAPNMTQMADPLTALMYAVQVMNFLKVLVERTLRTREETLVEPNDAPEPHPFDENGHPGNAQHPSTQMGDDNGQDEEQSPGEESKQPDEASIITSIVRIRQPTTRKTKNGQPNCSSNHGKKATKRLCERQSMRNGGKNKGGRIIGRPNYHTERAEIWL